MAVPYLQTSRVTRDVPDARGMSTPTKRTHCVEIDDLQALGMQRRTAKASRMI
jgi:hypothetical protein